MKKRINEKKVKLHRTCIMFESMTWRHTCTWVIGPPIQFERNAKPMEMTPDITTVKKQPMSGGIVLFTWVLDCVSYLWSSCKWFASSRTCFVFCLQACLATRSTRLHSGMKKSNWKSPEVLAKLQVSTQKQLTKIPKCGCNDGWSEKTGNARKV